MSSFEGVLNQRKSSRLAGVLVVSLVALFALSGRAHAASFSVTNTSDAGAGSLRQAITDANSNSNPSTLDTIDFAIVGSGLHTISVTSALPDVTEKISINGYSQTGTSANTNTSPSPFNNTITIELSGASFDATGLGSHAACGLVIRADNSEIHGLSVFGFSNFALGATNSAIYIAANNVKIQGNYLGVRADGTNIGLGSNDLTLLVEGAGTTIGGELPGDRNIIGSISGSNQGAGVSFGGSGNGTIYGNYIGLGKDGITDLSPMNTDVNGINPPFSFGVNLTGSGGNIVGGATTARRNIVSGGTANVIISSDNNTVQGNYIGTDYQGNVRSTITNGVGTTTSVGDGNLFGGVNAGEGNLIAGVAAAGINVSKFSLPTIPYEINPTRLAILGNIIRDVRVLPLNTFGNSNLGIDITASIDSSNPADFLPDIFENFGPNVNDAGDGDDGANGMINSPTLKSAQQVSNQITVKYDLDSADSPTNAYRIEFFTNDESTIFGYGPGQEKIGVISSTGNGTNKTATFTVTGDYADKSITATATAIDGTTNSGFGATSEFSRNLSIGSSADFDSDGAVDALEDLAPNGGDGNNDGIPDKLQPTVTSFKADGTSVFTTLVTNGCSENGTVASIDVSSLAKMDAGKSYPYGLTDFSLNCSRGDTVTIHKYVFVNADPATFTLRKYNPNTQAFTAVAGSTITRQTVGSAQAIVSTYSITDGGQYDDDGVANGLIVDPVGLATTQALANTGENIWAILAGAGTFIVLGAYFATRQVRRK